MQKLQRFQHVKVRVQAVKGQTLVFRHAIFLHLRGDGEQSCDIQKLPGCQRGVDLQQAEMRPDIGQSLKR